MKVSILLVALLGVTLLPRRAVADEESERRARALFAEGMKQVDAGDFEKALARFEQAYALFPTIRILLNIAGMLGELGRNAEAADAYARYLDSPEADPAMKPDAKKRLAELDALLAKIQFELGAPGMRVRIDGKRTLEPRAGSLTRVEPGTHTVVGEQEGATNVAVTLTVAAGETKLVKLEPTILTHGRQIGAVARIDIEGHGRGVVGVLGLTYGVTERVELSVAALLGSSKGIEPGVTVAILKGVWKPIVALGVPVFFRTDGAFPGVRMGAGLAWNPIRPFGAFAQAALAVFPSAPRGFDKVVFLPTVGVQAWY